MSQPGQPTPAAMPARDTGAPDFASIKQRQQATWASGDFAVIGVTLQIVGEALAEAADIRAHETVLDIAAGNGNATLAAARRFANVVSTDYVPALLEKGRVRAEAEGLAVDFREADAEALPFPDASFDVAVSTFGVMFTPDHTRAANEMLRVVRGGGRIALANWTPDGFVGQLFKLIGKYVPPPAGLNRRRCGARKTICASCSAAKRPTCTSSASCSISATARGRTCCKCFATTTVRCTRPLPRSPRMRRGRWNKKCCRRSSA